MSAQIFNTSSGWYYDVIDAAGHELVTRAYFDSYAEADAAAQRELMQLQNR